MAQSKKVTEGLLHNAFERLLKGEPIRVKPKGKLTLNKINNEAGLSHSYVHKFEEFVKYATPKIDKFNEDRQDVDNIPPMQSDSITEIERLKLDLKHERKLKNEYRLEKIDLQKRHDILEEKYQSLVYQLFIAQTDNG